MAGLYNDVAGLSGWAGLWGNVASLWSGATGLQDGAGFSPLQLFAANEQGAWYDPSDLSTLFQDSAGTVPVTAAGQVVGRMLDKSGRGNHAAQSGANSLKPILQIENGRYFLLFDGTDDFLATGAFDLSGGDAMTLCVGARKNSTAGGSIAETGVNASLTDGCYAMRSNTTTTDSYNPVARGTVASGINQTGYASPDLAVLTGQMRISTDTHILRRNGTQIGSSSGDLGSGSMSTQPLYLGRRGGSSIPWSGRMYGLVIRSGLLSASAVVQLEGWMNSKTGAY